MYKAAIKKAKVPYFSYTNMEEKSGTLLLNNMIFILMKCWKAKLLEKRNNK